MSAVEERTFLYPDPAVAAHYAGRVLDVAGICRLLPHRPPMLMVDRIIELEPAARAVGVKAVTVNEPFFAGHFPGRPVMPGVLIIEALAQVSGMTVMSAVAPGDWLTLFTGIDDAKFRRPVVPGDLLRLEATLERSRFFRGALNCRAQMSAFVEGELVAKATGSFALIRPDGE